MTPDLLLAVDGGATKTLTLLATRAGCVLAAARTGPSNFQVVGRRAAADTVYQGIDRCLARAGRNRAQVAAAAYGLAGADRPADFATVAALLSPVHPGGARVLVNDTELALRAGTDDGVGVGLIAGTGTNAIGRDATGRREKVGGLGSAFGDWGCAEDLGLEAVRRAMRGHDGRESPTALYPALCAALGVSALADLAERTFHDEPRPFDFGTLAPVVFEVSRAGDAAAQALLDRAAGEYARAALTVMDRLFAAGEAVPLVLGGSLLQKGADPRLVETLAARVHERRPAADVRRLADEPAVGGLLLAWDAVGGPGGPQEQAEFRRAIAETLPAAVALES